MLLTFLSGPVALTKSITFSPRQQTYNVSAYPMVQRVTSHEAHVTSLDAFADAVAEHGKLGHALLQGNLKQPLVNESRAGHAAAEDHHWLVFDFDKVQCAPTFDGAQRAVHEYLPACCHDVDYLIQLSSSCYRPDAQKLSAHVFMLLEPGVSAKLLREWFVWVNFNSPLRDEMALTDSGMALHYPLDPSVASAAKLIYIAPPRMFGFDPAVEPPGLKLVRGKQRALRLPTFTPVAHTEVGARISALREAAGLPPREYKTRMIRDVEVMVDAEECVVHDVKPSGEGFIRFNMNGGDSLAYYINLKEPNLIGNHKGEPFLVTEKVAPDLYKALVKTSKNVPAKAMQSAAVEPFAFYATNRGSQLFVGHYDRENDVLRMDTATKDSAYAWLAAHGMPLKPHFPHYDVVYNMSSELRYEDGYPMINLYRQTEYMKKYSKQKTILPCDAKLPHLLREQAPVTYKVLDSVLGNNPTAMMYFLNWLGAIFQRKTRTNSGWVVSGVEGTGKGLLTNYIMRHMFGDEAVTQQLYEHVNDKFNEYLEGKLIVSLNEATLSKTIDRDNVMSKLRDWITEPKIIIRGMHKAGREADNHANFIVSSNSKQPIQFESHDRRWNVGEYQNERLRVTANELATITEGLEMAAFCQMLGQIIVDDTRLNNPYEGKAKATIYEATHNILDRTARAIEFGDVEFFLEVRPSNLQMSTDFIGKPLPIAEYDTLLRAMMAGDLKVLRQEDLYVLFRTVIVSEKLFPETRVAQRQIYQRYGLLPEEKPMYDARLKRSVRGIKAPDWRITETAREMFEEQFAVSEPNSNVKKLGAKS